MTAPQCAGIIHTDFERGFIRAEVTGYDDYVEYNGESGAKEAGKQRALLTSFFSTTFSIVFNVVIVTCNFSTNKSTLKVSMDDACTLWCCHTFNP